MARLWGRKKRGLTLIELLVILTLTLIAASILYPVISPPRAEPGSAPGFMCRTFPRQIGTAFRMYASDYDERLPPAGYEAAPFQHVSWHNLLDPYIKRADIWRCGLRYPNRKEHSPSEVDYGYNARYLTTLARDFSNWNDHSGISLDRVEEAAKVVLIADSHASRYGGRCREEGKFLLPPSEFPADCWGRPDPRHARGANVIWLDGHSSLLQPAQFYSGQHPTDRFFDLKSDPGAGWQGTDSYPIPRRKAGSRPAAARAGKAEKR